MRLREVERVARRVVPGTGAPSVRAVSAGLLHDTFRVDRDGCSFSVRLGASAQNGAWLERVLRLAADQTLAPPLVCADMARGIIVQRWVEGWTLPAASVSAVRNIDRIAKLLRRVHALPVPKAARTSSPAGWIRYYTAALAAQRAVKRAAAPLLAVSAKRHLTRLNSLPKISGVICHSDLHRLNVLEYQPAGGRTNALILLDWEYAHVSQPFWDLAGWSANNDFSDELLRRLLAAYLGRAPDEADWMRCRLLGWLYDYICLLWSEIYLSSRRAGAASVVKHRAAVLQARLIAGRI